MYHFTGDCGLPGGLSVLSTGCVFITANHEKQPGRNNTASLYLLFSTHQPRQRTFNCQPRMRAGITKANITLLQLLLIYVRLCCEALLLSLIWQVLITAAEWLGTSSTGLHCGQFFLPLLHSIFCFPYEATGTGQWTVCY